jgi:hypothetical protein
MGKLIALLVVLLSAIFSAVYYFEFYPPNIMRASAKNSLEDFNASVASKDRAKISANLDELLADDASIHLEINFLTLTAQNRPIIQDFNKQNFINFVDNTLYSLTDYNYIAELTDFRPSADRKTAETITSANNWADGAALYGGLGVNMRYSGNTNCKSSLLFSDILSDAPKITQMSCELNLRSIPKSGEASKFQNMNSLQDLLKKN